MSLSDMLIHYAVLQQQQLTRSNSGASTQAWTDIGKFACLFEPIDSERMLRYQQMERDVTGFVYAETSQPFATNLATTLRSGDRYKLIYYEPDLTQREYSVIGAIDEQERGRLTVIDVLEVQHSGDRS